nr:hypothetical protein CFP56_67041 [Quercus suber]
MPPPAAVSGTRGPAVNFSRPRLATGVPSKELQRDDDDDGNSDGATGTVGDQLMPVELPAEVPLRFAQAAPMRGCEGDTPHPGPPRVDDDDDDDGHDPRAHVPAERPQIFRRISVTQTSERVSSSLERLDVRHGDADADANDGDDDHNEADDREQDHGGDGEEARHRHEKWTSSTYDTSGLSAAQIARLTRKGINPALYAEMKAARKGRGKMSPLVGNTHTKRPLSENPSQPNSERRETLHNPPLARSTCRRSRSPAPQHVLDHPAPQLPDDALPSRVQLRDDGRLDALQAGGQRRGDARTALEIRVHGVIVVRVRHGREYGVGRHAGDFGFHDRLSSSSNISDASGAKKRKGSVSLWYLFPMPCSPFAYTYPTLRKGTKRRKTRDGIEKKRTRKLTASSTSNACVPLRRRAKSIAMIGTRGPAICSCRPPSSVSTAGKNAKSMVEASRLARTALETLNERTCGAVRTQRTRVVRAAATVVAAMVGRDSSLKVECERVLERDREKDSLSAFPAKGKSHRHGEQTSSTAITLYHDVRGRVAGGLPFPSSWIVVHSGSMDAFPPLFCAHSFRCRYPAVIGSEAGERGESWRIRGKRRFGYHQCTHRLR